MEISVVTFTFYNKHFDGDASFDMGDLKGEGHQQYFESENHTALVVDIYSKGVPNHPAHYLRHWLTKGAEMFMNSLMR